MSFKNFFSKNRKSYWWRHFFGLGLEAKIEIETGLGLGKISRSRTSRSRLQPWHCLVSTLADRLKMLPCEQNTLISQRSFFLDCLLSKLWGKLRLFGRFWNFQNYFSRKKQSSTVLLRSQRYNILRVRQWQKKVKMQIIAGQLPNLVSSKLSPVGNHHHTMRKCLMRSATSAMSYVWSSWSVTQFRNRVFLPF